ncbi:LysR substrate-binding domain-containing protein [Nocardia sp. CA-107356]|uniref:LysR substrate-binding domain-containing protein n=1 Tax=Nocardia sp. CA-107356 TaxID=3239972 RepID=UPI003D93AD59
MRTDGLTIRHLRYFVAVVEERNFTRAAARLHVAQQGVSEQVRQLEQNLGVRLLERSSRRVEPTSAGAAFYADATAILAHLDRAAERAQAIHREETGLLRVGFCEGAALTLTEPILDAIRERHPEVQVELRQFNYDDPSAGLSAGVVDVALLRLPVSTPRLVVERLFAEPVVLACAAGHRLAGRAEVTVAEVLEQPLLGSATDDPVWNAFWQLEEFRAGAAAPVVSRSTTLLEEMAKVTTGVGVVVTAAAARWIPLPGVAYVPIADAPRSVVAVAARGDHLTPLVRSFFEVSCEVRDAHPELIVALEAPTTADPPW